MTFLARGEEGVKSFLDVSGWGTGGGRVCFTRGVTTT